MILTQDYPTSKAYDHIFTFFFCRVFPKEDIVRPSFFYFLFYQFFSLQVRVGGRNKNFDFNSIGKWSE